MNVLISAVGFHDPVSPSLIDGEEQAGPILSLVLDQPYGKVVLLTNEATRERAKQTEAAIKDRRPETEVVVEEVAVADPLDYVSILTEFRRVLKPLMAEPDTAFSISVSSGTPSMHACWLLLAASGEFPARILNVRPARFVTAERPLVHEVDLTANVFPHVQVRSVQASSLSEGDKRDPIRIARALGIIGEHDSVDDAIRTCAALAGARVPCLIIGETGTGKELFARLIHELGRVGKSDPWVVVNCAAIPKDLVESELFGHTRGAFTGATNERVGAFEQADKGTLFLDEIGELPPPAQAKLLRALQEGEVTRVGESRVRKVDVRVVAATNREITNSSYRRENEFRDDLYHRLNVGVVKLLPLRNRRQDIPMLALYFFEKAMEKMGRKRRITQGALSALLGAEWPGNIRELRNTVERTLLLHQGDRIEVDDLRFIVDDEQKDEDDRGLPVPVLGDSFNLPTFLEEMRSRLIAEALDHTGGNQSKAAKLLGISAQAIHKHLRK